MKEKVEALLLKAQLSWASDDIEYQPSIGEVADSVIESLPRERPLFQLGDFTLHSGAKSKFKIECDALAGSWEALAWLISEQVKFSSVSGVVSNGVDLAMELQKYRSEGPHLVVDDVLTTGASILEEMGKHPGSIGYVVFARGPLLNGVRALMPVGQVPRERRSGKDEKRKVPYWLRNEVGFSGRLLTTRVEHRKAERRVGRTDCRELVTILANTLIEGHPYWFSHKIGESGYRCSVCYALAKYNSAVKPGGNETNNSPDKV